MPNLKNKHKTAGQRVVRAQPGAPEATSHAALRMNGLRTEGELHAFLIKEVAALFGAQRVLLVLERRLACGPRAHWCRAMSTHRHC